ncbi:MAG TPA: hypothetical protein VKU36_01145 [Candidatus Babeliales bacterium]|nr:hypothetical protein [Candidatus Babeliales bacterium]
MKKSLLFLSFFSIVCIYSMEDTQRWKITCNKTNIHLTTDLFEACDKAYVIVAGKHEQNLFHPCPEEGYDMVKTIYHSSIDQIYKDKNNKKEIHNAVFMKIVEPFLISENKDEKDKNPTYTVYTPNACVDYTGERAAVNAYADLMLCYRNALKFCMDNYESILSNIDFNSEKLDEILKKPTSIAISSLSTNVGLPYDKASLSAVAEIIGFIENNKQVYDDIYVAVNNITEFNFYKLYLLKRTDLFHKICLFYLGHALDKESILSLLPKDLIIYIYNYLLNNH